MSEKSLLLNLTGEMPLFKVIDFLLDNKGMDFSKKDIAKGAEISRASLFHYWEELEKRGIVRVTRRFGKTKLFLFMESLNADLLIDIIDDILVESKLISKKSKRKIIWDNSPIH